MQNFYKLLFNDFLNDFNNINSLNDFNNIKIKYLGRNGLINKTFDFIKKDKCNNKIKLFKDLNFIKNDIQKKIDLYNNNDNDTYLKYKNFDITLPPIGNQLGSQHIISKTINDIKFFFLNMGFKISDGYEIDTSYYNFEALNMPLLHPSRNLNETFYISNNVLLRTHTSNMQIHLMQQIKPPLKFISYGKVYRRDLDASHTPMFHQLEGFIIDKNISISNLKYLISNFLTFFFKKKVDIKFRSSYFPFTEPSMEIDIKCIKCNGLKCSLCKYSGWIEVLGCGLVHSNVLTNCGINNNIYSGLAFGMGIERLSMIKYRIDDIRLYFDNNINFLNQF